MKTLFPAPRASLPAVAFALVLFAGGAAPGQTNSTCTSPLSSDFFSRFTVVESAEYVQTNAAGPVLDGTNTFHFQAAASLNTNLTASAATLTVPGQAPQPMTPSSSRRFVVSVDTNSFDDLTATFPGGDYSFVISNQSTTVHFPAVSALPNAPALSDYQAAQTIDSTKDFTLAWDRFAGGDATDVITLVVADKSSGQTVFETPRVACPGALDGAATSVLIPAGALSSNQIYTVDITFIRVLTFDTNSIAGDALLAGTEAETLITVATGPGAVVPPPSAPVLTNAAWLPGGSLRFDFTTTPGASYTLQFNQNLANPAGWISLLTTNAVANLTGFTNIPPPGAAAGFYRALQN
jgi:hypothetical protein